jgi:transcriptional regulator with AAA-type ATPase domain
MDQIFLLEDEPHSIQIAREMLCLVAGRDLSFHVAQSLQQAEAILSRAEPGTFDLLLFDLLVPRSQGANVDRDRDTFNGLDAVKAAWGAGHRSGIFVLSQLMDNSVVSERVLDVMGRERIGYVDCLEKSSDLTGLEGWKTHFSPYLEDLRPLKQLLWERADLLIAHPSQEHVLRQFLERLRRGLEVPPPRLDSLLLTGQSGAGKSFWAKAGAWLKGWLVAGPDGQMEEAPFAGTSLSSYASEFADSDRLKLFGGRNYNQSFNDGVFLAASWFPSRFHRPITRYLPDEVTPDRRRGGLAFVDEVMSANPSVQDSTLRVLDIGEVEVIGASPASYQVACTAVFATNLEIAVRYGGAGEQRGEMGEAFRSRLGVPLRIPSLRELGWSAAQEILLGILANRSTGPRSIAPASLDLLREAFEANLLTMRSLRNLVEGIKAARITPGAIRQFLTGGDPAPAHSRPEPASPPKAPESGATEDAQPRSSRLLVDEEEIRKGEELWRKVCDTQGEEIGYDLLAAASLPSVSGETLFAMLLTAYASLQEGKVAKKDFDAWLGLSRGNDLRHKLRALGNRYPSLFHGSGKSRSPTMRDLNQWLGMYRQVQLPT